MSFKQSAFRERTKIAVVCAGLFFILIGIASAVQPISVGAVPRATNDFPLVRQGAAAAIVFSDADAKVVEIAARLLRDDIQRVSDVRPTVTNTASGIRQPLVLIGTIGKNPDLDRLISSGKLRVDAIHGKWESFLIQVVENPFPGVSRALVIAGSDRRGTAYGALTLSEAIGVSPWYWWADVAPEKRPELYLPAGLHQSGPPSVKYRGIFINDEDWGLQPWASKTFEPETGDIGPKTYAKVFELLLRLKANTLWPAMHACTKPFNAHPQNAKLADDHAIVMGSSHAEPMLRNNVGEWNDRPENFNYATNREGVRAYWEERVRENGRFENVYTLGMRGIHDSRMQGPRGRTEQIALLEQIFSDERDLLRKHVGTNLAEIPQVFCAYKEVLDLYRGGLKVPDDVTIMFPDDNFGYIRTLPGLAERKRKGGFGIYYHISYLGRPLSYLWLGTTPPALIWEEMTKAYEHGAREIWIVNVGDIKPAEIGTEFFLQLAWDVNRWGPDTLDRFLKNWAAREFGPAKADEIAALMNQYYRLNFQRKPEHLQWWLPSENPQASALTDVEVVERLQAFAELQKSADGIAGNLPDSRRDAFFQLVQYPVTGAALANRRYFLGESGMPEAMQADAQLKAETQRYDQTIAGGKWRHFMALEPADNQWRGMRVAPWTPRDLRPPLDMPTNRAPSVAPMSGKQTAQFMEMNGVVAIEAEHFTRRTDHAGAGWKVIGGLGRSGDSIAVFPTTARVTEKDLEQASPSVCYRIQFQTAGEFPARFLLLPTFPVQGSTLRLAVGINEEKPRIIEVARRDGTPEWARGVLDSVITVTGTIRIPQPGWHELRVYMVDPGVVIDKVVIDCAGLTPSYLGPAETRFP